MSYALPISIELAGILFLVMGIVVEIVTRAELGYILISVGSAFIAIGSLIWAKVFKVSKMKNECS